ncbi:MAG TPA: transporter substrate-binding domain-containing protein [Acidimicrobiia bacterium]|nr:transporter substrate-binding domain-containing protein [Acidimicrobiia bacterium]
MQTRRMGWHLALLLAATLVLGACTGAATEDTSVPETTAPADAGGEAPAEGEDRLSVIKDRGSLIVGMTLQFEPQMYRDENNEPAGYDVELVNMLATDLQVELEIMDQEFDSLIPGMLAGQFDLISVGLVNRPERAEQLWFTRPYVPYRQVAVVNNDSGIESVEDLNSSDVTITALIGSTAANFVTTNFPEAELVELEQQPAFLEVAAGRADAIVVEEYQAFRFVEENDNTSVLNPDDPFNEAYGRWVVPVGDDVWFRYVDNWIDFYTSSGTLDQLYEEIIGPTQGLPR